MSRRAIGAATAALALGATGVLSVSCANVIDANGYEDAAAKLCACGELRFSTCEDHVRSALTAASDAAVEDWLANFERRGCGESCKNAARCVDADPVCADEGRSCVFSEECCGWSSEGGAFCYETKCVRDEPECRHTGEPCESADQCCGFVAGTFLTQCTTGVCIESCSPANPVNCPDCCATLESMAGGAGAVCLENAEIPCELFCNPEGPEPRCPGGAPCDPACDPDGSCIYLCPP